MGKKKVIFNVLKSENYSDWYTDILNKAEISDIRYGIKGFIVIRPWGAKIMNKMYKIYESALQRTGHDPVYFPVVISEENFKKESGHVEGFFPEVFWLEDKKGEEKVALRPTSETAFYQMYNLWIRSHRDLPLKLYQKGAVYRNETKATRPLIRGREFFWIEAHDAFSSKKDAEAQVKDDIDMTEVIMHKIFGVPFLPMRRPEWDKFPGAEYTIGSDSIMPNGRVIQQPSTHLISQNFSKVFNVKFIDENEKEKYAWMTCYGPSMSRIMASIISVHGDDKGLILPYTLSPLQVVIVPINSKKKNKQILDMTRKINLELIKEGIDSEVDETDKRPGEKYFYWEMKGVPFRLEIGEKEIEEGKAMLVIRDTGEKKIIKLGDLAEEIKNLGVEFDSRLIIRADEFFGKMVEDSSDKSGVKSVIDSGKVARFSYCSIGNEGRKCAEYIEKDLLARVMGVREDIVEVPKGKCIFCGKKAGVVVYAGKSY